MIKSIKFIKYKKFQDMEFTFSTDKLNMISGQNGTGKSSLLYLVSNSFQEPTKSQDLSNEQKGCLDQIKNINHIFNPKIEKLTKGDKRYNNPAKDVTGSLYSVTYEPPYSLDFRRHNATKASLQNSFRYRLVPKYLQGTSNSLPFCPIVYLGLSRLVSFGEFQDEESVKKITKKLKDEYQIIINDLFKGFTGLQISNVSHQKMGNVKHKSDFSTNDDGIDSNTISAGQDNLYIILTALVSLRYYYEVFNKSSILLIDEVDATLHPAFQLKLLLLLQQYSRQYQIQIFFTTHSLTLIEYALSLKENILYFINKPSGITTLEKVDMATINRLLLNVTTDNSDIFTPKKIPIFTEDAEARLLLEILFDYFCGKDKDGFSKVRNFLYIVEDISIGSENLKNMFKNKTIDNFKWSICILDGDKHSSQELNNNILVLPGQDSPEKFLFEFAKNLVGSSSDFWDDLTNIQNGFTSDAIRGILIDEYNKINEKCNTKQTNGESIGGFLREEYKKLFNNNIGFMRRLFGYWIKQNESGIDGFFKNLQILFYKNGKSVNIDISSWPKMDANG